MVCRRLLPIPDALKNAPGARAALGKPAYLFQRAGGFGRKPVEGTLMADSYSEPPRATRGEIVSDARKKIDEQLQRANELRANPLLLAETEEALRIIDTAARH